ncbi:helix-turn-helix transcriptional regulator [Chelatococcus sp. GCM10030263]|uniref:helix-turn-helix transcriptional regulator n=1 Tax=Chelatococcus sp. GCM10030263 TaxID=3273387 RepID=UPI00361D3631
MARADAILAAVQHIHEAPLTTDGWTRALPSIARALCSEHGILLVQNAGRKIAHAVSFEMTSEQTTAFAGVAASGSKLWEIIRALPAESPTPTSALSPDREYARTRFYNEGVRPLGAFHGLVLSPLSTPQRLIHLSTGRRLGREDYNAEDVAAMRILVPHLVNALHVAQRLAVADLHTAGAEDALDLLETGVILVDPVARILFANRTATAIIDGNDGLTADRDGIRACCSQNATRLLRRLIASCACMTLSDRGPGGRMEVPRRDGRGVLRVVVAPFRAEEAQIATAWLGAARPAAILMIANPQKQELMRKEDLRHRYGLTPAEADVALEIAKGDGREAVGARLGITANTVRAHLSQIFGKTGLRRQAELVRLLMRG